MYITISDIVGKKRINLTYLIRGKKVVVVSVFSNNIQNWIKEPFKVMLIMNEEKQLPKGS